MAAGTQAAFELLAGPLLVLIGFALMLFGVFSTQCYVYWFTYEKDSRMLRTAVLLLWAFEACHTAFCMHIAYTYLIIYFGDPVHGVEHIVWSVGITVMCEMIIVIIVESFYLHRIYRLSESALITALPAFFLVPRVVLGFAVSAYLFVFDTWEAFTGHPASENILNTSLSLGVVTDLIITILLIYYLRRRQSRVSRTKHIIQRLQRNTVNNGALSVILSVVIIITLHAIPNSLLFAGLVEIISKVYANSMIATLNARQSISKLGNTSKDGFNSIQLSVRENTNGSTRVDMSREGVFINSAATQSTDRYDQKSDPAASGTTIMKTTETFVV
ncbi:hypothetical protein BDY19DRAFT_994685 [Irpex rosettiformis]|uniref:Uncharacterized protein n=1 Tax=Irpex rosettiformis TaxID=378272 RepID=A0ACB8U0K6_9APHY|nr:hypothetical protein BDY19DRAFT_994685 [Irpex rosettiformis]